MVNPTQLQQDVYEYLSNLEDFAINEIKPGVRFSELAEKIVEKVTKEKPKLAEKMQKNFGYAECF